MLFLEQLNSKTADVSQVGAFRETPLRMEFLSHLPLAVDVIIHSMLNNYRRALALELVRAPCR